MAPSSLLLAPCSWLLFIHRFQLLIDYLAPDAVNGEVQPVTLLAFNHELSETRTRRGRRITARLSDNVDHQILGGSLKYHGIASLVDNCSRNGLGAPKSYIEPSYLISTCCDIIAPVVGFRVGLTNT